MLTQIVKSRKLAADTGSLLQKTLEAEFPTQNDFILRLRCILQISRSERIPHAGSYW